ncbi:MAG: nickel pincer cofactor biosynthesis protein LarB, partial [Holophagales bacterium]|nr:nickel pincer cofactor biosynthesis protein LarB [Holophagales bacterium]
MSSPVTFDAERRTRIGLAEAILCAGKAPAHLTQTIETALASQPTLLLTRLDAEALDALPATLRQRIDYDPVSRTGIIGALPTPTAAAAVALVTAGTSDAAVAREAQRTLDFYGVASNAIDDVGVAGLWRLLEREETLRRYRIVIVVAGMDGALPSVIGGLVPGVVIAVPTSTGYGAARGG